MRTRRRTAGRVGDRQRREAGRPPPGENWVWFTREMIDSPAWEAMPLAARKVLEAMMSEHLQQGGTRNGSLVVTYDEIAARGVRRSSIPEAIAVAVGLGWIDVTFAGGRSYGSVKRPSEYGVTWLPQNDCLSATHRWKTMKSIEQAKEVVERITKDRRDKDKERRALHALAPTPCQDIEGSNGSVPREPVVSLRGVARKSSSPSYGNVPGALCGPDYGNVPGEKSLSE